MGSRDNKRKEDIKFINEYREPYNKVLHYIKEHLDESKLREIFGDDYDKIKKSSENVDNLAQELADTITDVELFELGYFDSDDSFEEEEPYEYENEYSWDEEGYDEEDENYWEEDEEFYEDDEEYWDEECCESVEGKEYYEFNNVLDVVDFLQTLDEDTLNRLFDEYYSWSLTDLAVVLPDHVLEELGYANFDEPPLPPEESEYELAEGISNLSSFNYIKEYNENFDFLEDLPDSDINVYIIDEEDNLLATNTEADFYNILSNVDRKLIDEVYIVDEDNFDDLFLFRIKPHNFKDKNYLDYNNNDYFIDEDVVINDTLNPTIFDLDTDKMIDDVKESLINYVDGFVASVDDTDLSINLSYDDIVLIGSNAGYLYRPDSDIDIHIILDNQIVSEAAAETLFNLADLYEDENPLFFGESRVELGFEDNYDYTTNNNKDGGRRYSLINNDWLNNSNEIEHYKQGDESLVDGYEKVVDQLTEEINKVVDNDDLDAAIILKQRIRQNRSDDLANIGSLSMGNVVFKELRDNGSYEKLKNYIYNAEVEAGGFIE